jgi:2-polyprenyl-3-methyl-5-hydroxy-6-metoxy-1,4-benzoquinol methylase
LIIFNLHYYSTLKQFHFKEHDQEGMSTLEILSEADRLNRWMYETILPYCSGRILEVGSGIGNISQYFLDNGHDLVMSDIRQEYTNRLEERFAGRSPEIHRIDISLPDFTERHQDLIGTFDTVFSLNVLEHIEDEQQALQNYGALLKPGGRLIILVPAYQVFYNGFDRILHHYRRYTRKSLKLALEKELNVIHTQYFNVAGILGWFVSGSILRNKELPGGQVMLYNRLVPLFRLADKLLMNSVGLSVIAVGKKTR